MLNKLLNFSIENKLQKWYFSKRLFIHLLFIAFAINIIIYGQKIFFLSLPADDFMRFSGDDNLLMLIERSGRWAQVLLNQYIFVGKLQILPYLHGIIGIFIFTMLGILTSIHFKLTKTYEILIATLLISSTPMFAHNLYFSTNITAWIGLLIGFVGYLLLTKSRFILKLLGFFFIVFSIGCYQTIIQILLITIIFKAIIKLLQVHTNQEILKLIVQNIVLIILILLAYIFSKYINTLFLEYHHLSTSHRLSEGETLHTVSFYLHQIYLIYFEKEFVPLDYFSSSFYSLYVASWILATISTLTYIYTKHTINLSTKMVSSMLFLLLLYILPLIVNLPLLLNIEIPLRAYFPIGWVTAGFFTLQMISLKGTFKSLASLISILILIISIYYITLFYEAGIRQTNEDIKRANSIVNRIRTHENYTNEPISLYIYGGYMKHAYGWYMTKQETLDRRGSKYKIFKYFTDLKFKQAKTKEIKSIEKYIISNYKNVYTYPGKNSVVVYKNIAIVFFSDKAIQKKINTWNKK